jgi:ribosomal protein L7/L12
MASLTEKDRQAVQNAIFSGKKIEAIKLYREAVPGSGLAEAKQGVETLEAELRMAQPEKFSAPPKKAGCAGMLLGTILVWITVVLAITFVVHR